MQITYPADQSIFTTTDTDLHITAEATDTDGSIAGMQLLINDVLTYSTSDPAFDYAWSNPGAGAYQLLTLTTDDDGAVSYSDTIHVVIEDATATRYLNAEGPCKLFPNPVFDIVNLLCDDQSDLIQHITVTNLQGKVVSVPREDDGENTHLDMSVCSPGVYIISLTNTAGVWVERVMKQ